MAFDIIGAKRAGYSDTEIADYLAQQTGFDAAGARGAGYSDQEIIGHVSGQVDVGADKPKEKSSLVRRAVGDTAISTLKGAIGLPESVVGLADIATGGRVGKALETVGYRPKEAKQILDTMYSPEQQEANAAVQQAQGFVPTLKAAVENPSTIFHSAVESAPSMIGAGGIARGGMKILPKISPVVAGALGEGAMSAGSTAEQIRQDSPDGNLTPAQSSISLGSGALTSGLGIVGGKVAQRLGITDIDSFLASGAPIESKKAVTKAIIEGAISEGVLEEMPQSAQEQAAQNLATGRPIGEGVGNATAMGGITGGVMGGGGNVIANTSPAPAGPLSRAVGMADTRAVAPVQPIGQLVAERRGMNAQPQPVTMSAPVEQPVAQPEPVAVEQPAPMPSRAAAPASSLSSLISQARNRVPTLPAIGIEGATNEGQRNDEGQGQDEGRYAQEVYADAEGNGQDAQAGLPQRGDGADAQDERGVAANLPESQQNTDAQISPVTGLSEPIDTQVSPEKGEETEIPPRELTPEGHTKIYRGVEDIGKQSQAGISSKGVESGNFWTTNREVAQHYAGKKGQVLESVLPNTAKVLDLEAPEGQQVYEQLTNRKFDPYRVVEHGIDERTTDGRPLADALREQGYDAVHSFDMDGPETLILNKGILPSPPSPKVEAPAPVGEDSTEQEAIAAMREGRVFLSRDGKTFMLSEEGGGGYKPSGKLTKAPWDKSIRAKYPDFKALYDAAKEAAPVGEEAVEVAAPVVDPTTATRNVLQQLAAPKRKSDTLVSTLKDAHGKEILNQLVKQEMVRFPGQGRAEITKAGQEWLLAHVLPAKVVKRNPSVPKPAANRGVAHAEKNRAINPPLAAGDHTLNNINVPTSATDGTKGLDSHTPVAESISDRTKGDTELFSNPFERQTFSDKGFSGLKIPSQRAVLSRVVAMLHDDEVRDFVVKFIPVDVVDVLGSAKLPAKVALHDESMFPNNLAAFATANNTISIGRDTADKLARTLARFVAEKDLASSDIKGFAVDGLPTSSAVNVWHGDNITQKGKSGNEKNHDPSVRYSTDSNTREDLTLDRVRSSFPTLPVTEYNGTFTVTTPSGIPIRISKVGEIEFGPEQRAAAEKEYGRKLRPDERPSAEFRPLDHGAIINLTERGVTELSHESFHAAMNLSLTERQKAAVLRTFGNEEKAAAEYQRLKESGALEGKRGNYWLSKIYRFLRALRQLISPTAKGVMEDVASGKVWGKAHAGDGGARYAALDLTLLSIPKSIINGVKSAIDQKGYASMLAASESITDSEYNSIPDVVWRNLPGLQESLNKESQRVNDKLKGLDPASAMAKGLEANRERHAKAIRKVALVHYIVDKVHHQGAMYSLRSAFTDHNPAALKSSLTVHPKVQALVGSVFNNGRNVSPWMRTVGTMYHMAEKLAAEGKPEFKRVFDKGQEFLTDVSTLALKAEAAAPDIFPKMGTGKGIFHNLPRKDAKAIAEPLYQGTLYGGADPKKGKVFTDIELKRIFHLSDQQIKLYRQARAATDQSLDDMAKSLIARNAKEAKVGFDRDLDLADMAAEVKTAIEDKVADMKAALAQAEDDFKNTPPDPDEKAQKKAEKAHQSFVSKQEAAIALHESLIANVDDLAHKTDTLKKRGYFPLMRFGQYTVTMKGRDGKVQFFGLYESAYKARLMADALAKENADHTVTQAVMGREKFKLFAGMNLEALQLFADHIKAEDSEAYQEYLKQAMNNRSAMKRLIHRKGTEGYSDDAVRTLASFITSNARHASTQYHLHDMQKLATEIPDDMQGDVQDQAVKLYEYLSKPAEEASKLRGYLFFHYLGGSLASGIVNMTQPVMMTMPYLASKTTAAKAAKHLTKASKMSFTDPAKVGGELGVALRRAESEGVTAPQEIYQLTAMASNKLLAANPYWNAGMKAWGGFFSVAEAFNRRVTFIASYRISREKGLTADRAYSEAVKAITETQGIYNKGNRPKWGRGMVGGTLFTFKQFSVMYLELFNRLPVKQKGIMLGILWLMAGLQGMPFAEDAEDIIDTIGQWAGFATNSKRWLNQTAEDALGKDAGNFVTQGISSVLPLDLQGRMGLQNLIPGTAILKQSETDKGRDVKEFFGPAGGLLASLGDALTLAATGMPGRAALAASPRAIQNYAQGMETIATGAAHDKFGRKTVELSPAEAAMKFTGFNPSRIAEESQVKSANHQDVNLLRVRKQEIVNQWAYGIANKDRGEIAEAKRKLVEWNRKNPELKLNLGGVVQSARQKSRALQTTGKERFIKSMPKEIRKRVIDELG